MRYAGENINYTDISGVSYTLTKTSRSIYFVPVQNSTEVMVKIQTKNNKIYTVDSLTNSLMTFTGKREEELSELFAKLIFIIDNVLKPFVLENMQKEYELENKLVIDDLTITADGMYKKRGFWRKPEKLEWNDYYNSILSQGWLQGYRCDEKKKYKLYTSISMSVINAVILPDFLAIHFNKNSTRKPEIYTESKNKFCHSCSSPTDTDDTFCTHCGDKLIK